MNDELLAVGTAMRFASNEIALRWAKANLPKEEYNKIEKSYKTMLKKTTIFVLLVICPIVIFFTIWMMTSPITKYTYEASKPAGATSYHNARIDYDGNFWWTYDSKVYEYSLEQYGFAVSDYEFGDEVKVWVDDNQGIIKVEDTGDEPDVMTIEVCTCVFGVIVLPVMLVLLYRHRVLHTFGKPWHDFYEEYVG